LTDPETFLATHLRYAVWATRRTLEAVRHLSPREYVRDLGASFRSVRGILEHMLVTDWGWYELLAGESPGITDPPDTQFYAEFSNLENDYRALLVRYEILASFLDDPELATRFAYSQLEVPWLDSRVPKWQGLMHLVNHGTYHRGQIAALMRQLGHAVAETDLIHFYLELEGRIRP